LARAVDEPDLSKLPEVLRDPARRQWFDLCEALPEATELLGLLRESDDESGFVRLLATSEFFAETCRRQPDWLLAALASCHFDKPLDPDELAAELRDGLHEAASMAAAGRFLRRWRNRRMAQIVWRDFCGQADMAETTAQVSLLADSCLQQALDWLYKQAVTDHGVPLGEYSGEPQQMVVMGLGKLGAGELNLSSDIDLVFAFPEDGTTEDGRKTNQQFFVEIGQRLIQLLDNTTADGFVFRVDMRLRPFGDAGPLVCSFAAMERYFEEHGRDWERYAWIRARVSAGEPAAGAELLETLRPFVFRRYLDFGAIEALRDMKARISAERSARAMADDIKLGPGGIRDVEFIAQVMQLIWAGRFAPLRQRGMRGTYQALSDLDLLDDEQAERLYGAYEFLRNLEHKLQGLRDRQTQKLPADDLDKARVALLMGYPDYAALSDALMEFRRYVAAAFDGLIRSDGDQEAEDRWHRLWQTEDQGACEAALAEAGFGDPATVAGQLQRLRTARDRPWVGREGRDRLDQLMPLFLASAAATAQPDLAVARVVPLFEAVIRRSAYFMLLLENPQALAELVQICANSRWLSDELAQHPALLDELLDPSLLYTVADKETLAQQLAERLSWVAEDDFEAQLEVLRRFKESHAFRVAACELKGILPLMHVSDYYTYLAEVILQAALRIAWRSTEGAPDPEPRPFIIVGYGKLGGLELGPDSDLDIVFVHQLDDEHSRFLHRMVRRLMQVLTTRTHSGSLYEVDMRLRPSGHAGTLVSSLEAFERYQSEDAWTWEHQALVRARVVAGDPELANAFDQMRRQTLCQPRDREALQQAVVDMRRRIEEAASGAGDLKRHAGGIVDIEFIVQYLVLAWASEHPELCRYSDNIRILETAAELGLISVDWAARLKEAYLALRAERHRTALDLPDDRRASAVLERYQDEVRACWTAVLGH
jgi:[glutamine synthetase] adenylyltransferase / [glutamine synthetase]-adenylyl-L-tyrosine phosphorylase